MEINWLSSNVRCMTQWTNDEAMGGGGVLHENMQNILNFLSGEYKPLCKILDIDVQVNTIWCNLTIDEDCEVFTLCLIVIEMSTKYIGKNILIFLSISFPAITPSNFMNLV